MKSRGFSQFKRCVSVGVVSLTLLAPSLCASPPPREAFLAEHCIKCHGPKKQISDRRFDTLPKTISSLADLEQYQEIVDQLNLQTMPPEDQPQPADAERVAIINGKANH